MSAVTQELLDRIVKLDEKQQETVLEFVRKLPATNKSLSLGDWLAMATESRRKTREKYGETHYFNSQALLDELREEESE